MTAMEAYKARNKPDLWKKRHGAVNDAMFICSGSQKKLLPPQINFAHFAPQTAFTQSLGLPLFHRGNGCAGYTGSGIPHASVDLHIPREGRFRPAFSGNRSRANHISSSASAISRYFSKTSLSSSSDSMVL